MQVHVLGEGLCTSKVKYKIRDDDVGNNKVDLSACKKAIKERERYEIISLPIWVDRPVGH